MTYQLLVVEDDPAGAELLQEVLTREGATVTVALRSTQAAQLIASRPFDGIFLDLHMPGMDGWELTALVRASDWNRHTPVVIVSGSPNDAMKKAFAVGATLYLAKPVDPRKLRQAYRGIRSSIQAHRLRFVRLPFSEEIACRRGGDEMKLRSDNLSVGGMLLRSEHRFKVGDNLALSFTLESGERVTVARARVVRVDRQGRAALSFESVRTGDDHRLKEFVSAAVA